MCVYACVCLCMYVCGQVHTYIGMYVFCSRYVYIGTYVRLKYHFLCTYVYAFNVILLIIIYRLESDRRSFSVTL